MNVRKHKRKEGSPPFDPSYRIYYEGVRFTVLYSVVDKWGGRRVAVIEHGTDKRPTRIDPRLKCVKHICKVWQWGSHSRHGQLVGRRAYTEAVALATKLDQLWPLHFAAKELRGRVLYIGRSRKPGELKWIIRVISKLMPRSQQWLLEAGLIRIETNGTINLTQVGYAKFVRSFKPKKPKVEKCLTLKEP